MKQCIDYINNKHLYIFSFDKLIQLNNWCAKTYFDGCTQLYNLGRLSVPSEFERSDFLSTLSDEERTLLTNQSTGQINLNYKIVDAYLRLDKFEDRLSFEYLAQVLYAIEINNILCDMNRNGRERSNTGIEKVNINIKASDELRINKGTDYFNYDVLNCLTDTDDERYVGYLDFHKIYLDKIVEYIGLDTDTYNNDYVVQNKSLMFEGLTFDDDLAMVMFFLNGQIIGDTAIAKKFEEIYLQFYRDLYTDKDKNKPKSFFDKVYKECYETIDNYVSEMRNKYVAEGSFVEDRSISVEMWSFWLNKQPAKPFIPIRRMTDDFNIGVYVYNHAENDYVSDPALRLNGLSGEYIFYKDRRKYTLQGFPVIIDGNAYFPVYNAVGEVADCIELTKREDTLLDTSMLNVREKELSWVLQQIDRDEYEISKLVETFKRINKWWKTFDIGSKSVIIQHIVDAYNKICV